MRVTVWGENVHEQRDEPVRAIYPDGMHATIAAGLRAVLGEERRRAHRDARSSPSTASARRCSPRPTCSPGGATPRTTRSTTRSSTRVHEAVLGGMGLIALHSAHYSKIFKRADGHVAAALRWRNEGERELVWTVAPGHPIAAGVPHPLVIDAQEMYGEHFDIPQPDELVFISSFAGGEVFRCGCCFTRGAGGSSTSAPATRSTPSTTTPTCSG